MSIDINGTIITQVPVPGSNSDFLITAVQPSGTTTTFRKDTFPLDIIKALYGFGGLMPQIVGTYVFEGDSLTAGTGVTADQAWPAQFMLLPIAATSGTAHNVAVDGATLADITSRYAANVHPLSPAVTGTPGTLFVWIGANDFFSTSPSVFMTALESYWATAKADGWTLAAFTIIARNSQEAHDDTRDQINDMIRRSTTWDYLVDPVSLFHNPGDTGWYQSGGIHLTATGYHRLAKLAASSVQAYALALLGYGLEEVKPDTYPTSTFVSGAPHISWRNTSSSGYSGVSFFSSAGVGPTAYLAYPNASASQFPDSLIIVPVGGRSLVMGVDFTETIRINGSNRVLIGTATDDGSSKMQVNGAIAIQSGANKLSGTVTLSSGAGTITSTAIDANTVIVLSLKTSSGTPGTFMPRTNVTSGSATVAGLSTDNSTYNWIGFKVS